MNITALQKIAKSDKWQITYNRAKELGTLKLFHNDSDLSGVQIFFLYLLQMYNVLYQDLAEGRDYITEAVIKDDIRTEAYLLLRKEIMRKNKKENVSKRKVNTSGNADSVIFR